MNYKEKKEELQKKYETEIAYISNKKDVDLGVAFNMLTTWAKGLEHCPFVDEEELRNDVNELNEIALAEIGKDVGPIEK